ncbi:hypothetical protein D3C71_1686830 [compost metagenome]
MVRAGIHPDRVGGKVIRAQPDQRRDIGAAQFGRRRLYATGAWRGECPGIALCLHRHDARGKFQRQCIARLPKLAHHL